MNTTLLLVIGSVCCILVLFGIGFHLYTTYFCANLHDHFVIVSGSCIDFGKGFVVYFCQPSAKNKSTELSELIAWAKRSGYRVAGRHEVEVALERSRPTDIGGICALCSESDGKIVILPEEIRDNLGVGETPLISLIKATPIAA